MVKGVSRRVIVVDSPDPRIFEQAIFILPTDGGGVSSRQLVDEAVRVARSYARVKRAGVHHEHRRDERDVNHKLTRAEPVGDKEIVKGHPQPQQIVMEDNSYMTAIEANQGTADMLSNYRSLSDSDRHLIDTFVANLASKNSRL